MTRSSLLLAVLGVPVHFESNEPEVLEIARRALGSGAGPGAPAGAPLSVVIDVDHGLTGTELPPPSFVVGEDRVFRPAVGESRGRSEPATGRARAVVSPALLLRPDLLRHSFVEALTLWLVTHRDRCPLHAAAVIDGEHALLLCGESGSGKSTLAYAAYRKGLQVLSEDTVFVQTSPPVRVWGLSGYLHLLPDAERFFPELRGMPVTALPTGKRKVAVPLLPPEGAAAAPCATRSTLCLLSRGPALRLDRLPGEAVLSAIAGNSGGGFGYWADALRPAVESLGADGGWRLTVPDDPSSAIPVLQALLKRPSDALSVATAVG